MAVRNALRKRFFFDGYRAASPPATLENSPAPFPSLHALTSRVPDKAGFRRRFLTSPESADGGLLRRALNQSARALPELLSLPTGDKLREELRSATAVAVDCRRPDGLSPPAGGEAYGLTVRDARKILRFYQVEKVKAKLRAISESSISYGEFVRICVEECGEEGRGMEVAKTMDESGNVIVFGGVVLLSPEQVAKSMLSLISRSIPVPNDPRRAELQQMEDRKASIDAKARAGVRAELYCGLGLLTVQTLGFMRLTFWELSWDVMEPICFFVASLHFVAAYAFFLRTSREPSFEGFFRRRFETKRRKLFEAHNFDVRRYDELRALFGRKTLGNISPTGRRI
ncbi:calcium uniporter protein 4, mitochondrial-like [Rhodamnia argentea]|uniref:Calcium uniporter protein 4, mitochondrial-like n=1 Tax=Rhodamnia argentea TaxID=178133 RepID=A0A8B8R554_9MYRT|nr:calcium uniporter protein 4, mitochondrial-like [Rhodamnia argentea]